MGATAEEHLAGDRYRNQKISSCLHTELMQARYSKFQRPTSLNITGYENIFI